MTSANLHRMGRRSSDNSGDNSGALKANLEQWRTLVDHLESLSMPLNQAAEMLGRTLIGGGKLIALGNGGSGADAAHLATEFVCRFDADRPPYPALALSDPGSTISAIGNDYHFDEAYARQIHAFAKPGDMVLALSTSGQSENVYRALLAAREREIASVAMLGKDGGRCRGLADIDLLVPHQNTARIQEAHKLLIHSLCQMVEPHLGEAVDQTS